MKLAIGLVFATCALALVLVCGSESQPQHAQPQSDIGWRHPRLESVFDTPGGRITALSFTADEFTYSFWSEDASNIVWYSGFGGELLAWFHEGQEANGGRFGYVLGRLELGPDNHGRFPDESLIKSLRSLRGRLLREDVDRILLGMPLNAPASEVAARLAKKEFRSINHLFDWAAYAARQNRRESKPDGRHATILAAEDDPRDRVRRAANEAVDILQWH
jgi:hypothetical protein